MTATCVRCGATYMPARTTSRFCSGACRVAAHRAKEPGGVIRPPARPDEARADAGHASRQDRRRLRNALLAPDPAALGPDLGPAIRALTQGERDAILRRLAGRA